MPLIKRGLVLLILLGLLTGACSAESFIDWLFGETESTEAQGFSDWETAGQPTPAPTVHVEPQVPESALEDDGILRVRLRSLNEPQALNLTLQGVYAVEGDRGFQFERDTTLTLENREGEVWLYVGGLQLDMGAALTLTRHLDGWGEAGGVYIEESEKPTLYCGDLSVSAGESGLDVILTIQIEDYLKGVVGYEMSDSFPLEALKAQAVAARTYALQRKWQTGGRAYDLVDTTADQVFKGFDPAFLNVIQAVDETRGIVGTWEGQYATCYYTASNGGQTALAGQMFGDETADAYLSMRDDPCDLENPRSLQNDLTFSAECEGSIKLKQLLERALEPVMAEQGFKVGTWAFDSIAAIEPIHPRFEGSYLYDDLAFDLNVRVAEGSLPTPEPTPSKSAMPSHEPSSTPEMAEAPDPEKWVKYDEVQRVTLSVFDDIKEGLSMGLNGADCELISVEKLDALDGGEGFKLIMRRYGHGVGMSQRGAQTMAGAHGKTFLEILNFYYPGITIERMTWPDSSVAALNDQAAPVGASRPKPTPLPTPLPLPEPEAGERIAASNTANLNLREKPTTLSRILEVLDVNQQVLVSSEPDADGWVKARTAESDGYVKAEYLY